MTENYKQNVNRFNKVPAIIHNGFKLSESAAIFHYLGRQGIIPEQYYPKDMKLQAKIDEFLSWEHNGSRLASGFLFYLQWVQPIMTGKLESPEQLAKIKNNLEETLEVIENVWLKDTKFLTGDKITVADLFCASDIKQAQVCNYDATEFFPKIRVWLGHVQDEFNPHFDESHKFVDLFADKYKGVPPVSSSAKFIFPVLKNIQQGKKHMLKLKRKILP